MKISLIMVMTVDGVIAKSADHNAFTWTSAEDKKHFVEISKKIGTVMMGGSTFKASGRTSYKERLGIVLTSDPSKYNIGENVITKKGEPEKIYQELVDMGLEHVALIGGARTNADFIKAGLVDDIYLSIEPKMFGKGLHIVDDFDLDFALTLISHKLLNKKGTLLLHYSIDK